MATRKRKSPKGKGKRRQPGLASKGALAVGSLGIRGAGALGGLGVRGAGMLAGVVGRNPSIAGGMVAFAVIFSFVATNALWYQPGAHPSPFFRTRDPGGLNWLVNHRAFLHQGHDGSDVTTFRIERADAAPDAMDNAPATAAPALAGAAVAKLSVAKPATRTVVAAVPAERPAEDLHAKSASADPVAAAILGAEKDVKTGSTPKKAPSEAVNAVTMVMQIQKGLSNIAYTDVSVDGVAGDQTRAAIKRFQKHYQLPETGQPDMAVLKKLQDIGAL